MIILLPIIEQIRLLFILKLLFCLHYEGHI